MVEKLFDEVTKDWTEADWEGTSEDDLRYQISEFLDGNSEESIGTADVFMLAFEFEKYMGW